MVFVRHDTRNGSVSIKYSKRPASPHLAEILAEPALQIGYLHIRHSHMIVTTGHKRKSWVSFRTIGRYLFHIVEAQ
jgi:hypothetical protein